MIKDSNLSSKKNLIQSIISAEPVTYGAAPTSSNLVKFAFHKGNTIATGADGQIVFNTLDGSTGILYVGDQIVSSKILDVTYSEPSVTNGSTGVNSINVKYIADDKSIKTATLEVVNDARVKTLIAEQASADKERLDRLDTSVNDIEAWAKSDVITSTAKDIVIVKTATTEGYNKYDASVNIDGSTIIRSDAGVLSAGRTLVLRDASTGAGETSGHKFFSLTNADGTEASKIDVADVVGTSAIESVTYNSADNTLTIKWKTETGDTDTVIDLKELLDIDDITIASDSTNYLSWTTDASTGAFGAKIHDVSTATDTSTGLVDAKDVKDYIDSKSNTLAVKASGDTYVDASVDSTDNKKINVKADVQNVTYTAGTDAVYDTDGKVTTAKIDASLAGVENALVDGKQAVSAIKNYVDFEIASEAARSDANVIAAVKALDSSKSADSTNAHVFVELTDGKVTGLTVSEDYATVTRTKTTTTDATPTTDASIEVTDGTKLVTGADIEKVAEFVKDVQAQEEDRVNKKIADLRGSKTSDDATVATVKVDTSAGEVYDVTVTTISAGVNRDGDAAGARVLNASVLTGAVTGADIADIKGYVDDRFLDVTGAQDSSVSVSDASAFISTTIVMENGALTETGSALSYVHPVYDSANNAVTTNGIADGQWVLDLVNDRVADLDSSVKSETTNVNVEIVETDGKLTGLTVSEDYATVTTTDASVGAKGVTAMPTLTVSDDDQLATGAMVKTVGTYAKNYTDAALTWTII